MDTLAKNAAEFVDRQSQGGRTDCRNTGSCFVPGNLTHCLKASVADVEAERSVEMDVDEPRDSISSEAVYDHLIRRIFFIVWYDSHYSVTVDPKSPVTECFVCFVQLYIFDDHDLTS